MQQKKLYLLLILTATGLQGCSNTSPQDTAPESLTVMAEPTTQKPSVPFDTEYQQMRSRYSELQQSSESNITLNKPEKTNIKNLPLVIEDRVSPQFFFKPGQYMIPDDKTRFELENWIKDNLTDLKNQIQGHENKYGTRYQVNALIIGSSNGVATRPGGVPYKGELGDISIAANKTARGKESINIQSGETVTNAELSAIRAYSVANKFSSHLSDTNTSFDIRTINKKGGKHRYSQIVLSISQVK